MLSNNQACPASINFVALNRLYCMPDTVCVLFAVSLTANDRVLTSVAVVIPQLAYEKTLYKTSPVFV